MLCGSGSGKCPYNQFLCIRNQHSNEVTLSPNSEVIDSRHDGKYCTPSLVMNPVIVE
jgi:hypothetical protein